MQRAEISLAYPYSKRILMTRNETGFVVVYVFLIPLGMPLGKVSGHTYSSWSCDMVGLVDDTRKTPGALLGAYGGFFLSSVLFCHGHYQSRLFCVYHNGRPRTLWAEPHTLCCGVMYLAMIAQGHRRTGRNAMSTDAEGRQQKSKKDDFGPCEGTEWRHSLRTCIQQRA
jgi:hypothetical protein